MEKNQYLTPISVIVAGLIIAGALIYINKTSSPVTAPVQNMPQAQTGGTTAVDINSVNTTNEPFIGKANAPVTIAYWSDYQCPYCKEFDQQTLPELVTNYVDKGELRIVFKDFQFLDTIPGAKTKDSQTAGWFGRAVWELYPSDYFAWREAMYNAQDAEDSGFGDASSIIALTKTIPGIDADKVAAAVTQNQNRYQQEIDADKMEGEKLGVQGTPAFIIGTQLIPGVAQYSDLSSLIDTELKSK